jgi:aminoglycoside phosphotransferase (APT) family kinase protein
VTEELAVLERQLAARFPELDVAPLRHLETGFGSIVVETGDGIVFRVARRGAAAKGHEREATLLPALHDRVPLAVPQPRWRVAPGTPGFPYGAIGYPSLPGIGLSPELMARLGVEAVASSLAEFLLALHRFPVEEAKALGLPHADRDPDDLRAFRAGVLPALQDALDPDEYRTVSAWWDRLVADPEIRRFTPALRHGDLWYDHVLVDPASGRLLAVIDWEAAALGDPALDLAVQFHLGEPFAAATLAAYGAQGGEVDPGLRHRVRRLWELREFGGVRAAVELNDRDELEDAIRKLRAGPVLAGRPSATS